MAATDDMEKLAECLVAAILANASLGQAGANPAFAVKRYAEMLQVLRKAGGPVNPSP